MILFWHFIFNKRYISQNFDRVAKRFKKKRNKCVLSSMGKRNSRSFDESDMNEALEWIKESLLDVLDDRDEESTEGIPLVPLTDYSSAAMDSPSFQKLIRAMGFTPPADEQESYWRIPPNMPVSLIQKRCDLIESVLAGNFVFEGIILLSLLHASFLKACTCNRSLCSSRIFLSFSFYCVISAGKSGIWWW